MTQPDHCSYLLRLWRPHADAPWRVALIPTAQPDTHQHFDTLGACFQFLHIQTSAQDGCLEEAAPIEESKSHIETTNVGGEVHVAN